MALKEINIKRRNIKFKKPLRLRENDPINESKPQKQIKKENALAPPRNSNPISNKKIESVRVTKIEKEEIGRQLVDNRTTIGRQLVDNRTTIGRHLDDTKEKKLSSKTNRETIGRQIRRQEIEMRETIGRQLVDNRTTEVSIFELTGNEFKLAAYLCKRAEVLGNINDIKVTTEELLENLTCKSSSLKKIIERVKAKTKIQSIFGKRGRAKLRVFSIPQKHWSEWQIGKLVDNRTTIGRQLDDTLVDNRTTDRTTTTSSSSSIYNNKTTTTKAEIEEIDFTVLTQYGFSGVQLSQLINLPHFCLNTVLLEESIKHIAYHLEHYGKGIRTPLNWIMSELRKGYFPSPEGYLDPKTKAFQEYENDMEKKEKLLNEKTDNLIDKMKRSNHSEYLAEVERLKRNDLYPNTFDPTKGRVLVELRNWVKDKVGKINIEEVKA